MIHSGFVPLSAILAALLIAGAGEILKRLIIRKWLRFVLNPRTATFPKICPLCLSPDADSPVEEESSKRQTANYIVAHKLEWWKRSVPYCSMCKGKLSRNHVIGLVLGGVCAVAAMLIDPPTGASLVAFCYILFGYPAWIVATTIQKGVVFGAANADLICVRIRRVEYFNILAALNYPVNKVGPTLTRPYSL